MFEALSRNKTLLFWTLQVSGWSAYIILNTLQGISWGRDWGYLYPSMIYAGFGFVITLGLRQVYHLIWNKQPVAIAAVVVIASFIGAIVFDAAKTYTFLKFYPKSDWQPESLLDYVETIPLSLYVIIAWSGLYFGIKYYGMLQKQIEAVLKATNAAHQAQLKMLRYQLNPHFLFNTLNAISTLVLEGDRETANHMLTRLSAFLRHSLDRDPAQKVSLKSELDALNLYLSIEKIRFDERLQLKIEIENQAYKALVPSLILQPLIENSIKHAIADRESGGTISISARREGDRLCIVVSDTGPGAPHLEGATEIGRNGVGLANTRERLLVLYGDSQEFIIRNLEPHGLAVKICVPFESGNQ